MIPKERRGRFFWGEGNGDQAIGEISSAAVDEKWGTRLGLTGYGVAS